MSEQTKINKGEDEPQGTPKWMITFSDLSTLLLTFFVLLLAMSSMDDQTFKSLFTNFTSSCGILYYKEYGEIYRPKEILIEGVYERLKDTVTIRRADERIDDDSVVREKEFLKTLGGTLVIKDIKNGFKMVFGREILFPSGSAELSEDMIPVLQKVAKFMRISNYQIYIDGHTDNIAIRSSRYKSNEALSLERAYNLRDYFITHEGLESIPMAITGYGESKPVESNKTVEGREKNRRVEIIFKNQQYF